MGWQVHNLTQEGAVAPAANGSPTSHVVDDVATERTQHVFYAGGVGPGMKELWWSGSAAPQWDDLLHDHPGEIGLLSDPIHPPASHVFRAEGTQHVFCRGSSEEFNNHVFELWWRGGDPVNVNDLMVQSGEPTVGATSLTSHVFEAEGTQHVYLTMFGQIGQDQVDGHVGELWWRRGESAHLEDLTVRSGARTLAGPGLASHVVEEAGTQHVFYVAGTDVVELSWGGGHDWTERNLSQSSSPGPAEPATSRPASHFFTNDRTHHVFYTADNGRIMELSWRTGENPVFRDLSGSSVGDGVAPLAVSAPKSHVFDAELTQHVFYTGENGHVIELWWPPNDVARHEDLTVQSGGAPLAWTDEPLGTPASHVFASEGTQHVFYRSNEPPEEPFADIIELWWRRE
jgi:hypothetical protein